MRVTDLMPLATLLSASACADDPVPERLRSNIEFGPCIEFIGSVSAPEARVRALVPDDFTLDPPGYPSVQVRAIKCDTITITSDDGVQTRGDEHIVYQIGAGVLPPVTLDPDPRLQGADQITEYHAYVVAHVTNFEPFAEALRDAGFRGVYVTEDLTFDMGDDDPDACELIPVEGTLMAPAPLALSFSGRVRDLGLQPEDRCVFGEGDITTAERAVWWNRGDAGLAITDTVVPDSQILLFNADESFSPLPVTFRPVGSDLTDVVGTDPGTFDFTLSGLLELGEVFTTIRPLEDPASGA